MAIPAFIAANPGLVLQGTSILASLGASLTGRNDVRDAQRKAEEENKRRLAQGNLSRAFGGNPQVDLVDPVLEQSGLTKVLSGVGQAAGLGAQAVGLFNQGKLVAEQLRGRRLANDIAEGTLLGSTAPTAPPTTSLMDIPPAGAAGRIGARPPIGDTFAAPPSQFTSAAPRLSGLTGTPSSAPQLSGFLDPAEMLANVGKLSPAGRQAAQGALNDRIAPQMTTEELLRLQKLQSEIDLNNARTTDLGGEVDTPGGSVTAAERLRIKQLTPVFENLAAQYPELSFDEAMAQGGVDFGEASAESRQLMASLFQAQQREALKGVDENVRTYLYKELRPKVGQDQQLKNSGGLNFGMRTVASGYGEHNGFGDVNMIVGAVRMTDPTVSVRAEDVNTQEKAIPWLERLGVYVSGERPLEGDLLTEAARVRILNTAMRQYEANRTGIDKAVELFQKEALQFLPNNQTEIDNFLATYKLRPLTDYVLRETPAQRAQRLMMFNTLE